MANAQGSSQASAMPLVPMADWGRRLTETLRTALAAGDLAMARRLALEGDGQARSLAKEYTLMIVGLCLTVRLLLRLLGEEARRDATVPAAALAELTGLVRRFTAGLPGAAAGAGEGDLAKVLEGAAQGLDQARMAFERDQAEQAARIVAAIDAGDAARAIDLVQAKQAGGYVPLHDRLVRFMADSFAWVLRHRGDSGLQRFHLATAEGQRAGFEKWETLSPADFARTSAFLLKQHMGEVVVREEADRFTIEQTPCGSGGRLLRDGAYAGPDALPYVETAGPLTAGEPRLPVYCSHCPIWNGAATLRWFGRAQWVLDRPARADGSCTLHIYKRPDATPAEYAARVAIADDAG